MMKDTAKDEWKDANGIAKEDTSVTKVDVHKPAPRDSPDIDPSKEKELCVIN
jgi:hypothetical protein